MFGIFFSGGGGSGNFVLRCVGARVIIFRRGGSEGKGEKGWVIEGFAGRMVLRVCGLVESG